MSAPQVKRCGSNFNAESLKSGIRWYGRDMVRSGYSYTNAFCR